MSDDYEIEDVENFRGGGEDKNYSHKVLIMSAMRKVLESASNEMRSGYFNEKVDRKGNKILTYIQDTRKQFIEAVETLAMFMECDLDEEAQKAIEEIEKQMREREEALVNEEAKYWRDINPQLRVHHWKNGIKYREGYLHPDLPFAQDWVEERVRFYRKIFKELNKLTKRLNFYETEDLIV